MASKHFELEISGKTPEGAETKKSLKMDWTVIALLVVAFLVVTGFINAVDIIVFFKNLPNGLQR